MTTPKQFLIQEPLMFKTAMELQRGIPKNTQKMNALTALSKKANPACVACSNARYDSMDDIAASVIVHKVYCGVKACEKAGWGIHGPLPSHYAKLAREELERELDEEIKRKLMLEAQEREKIKDENRVRLQREQEDEELVKEVQELYFHPDTPAAPGAGQW